MKQKKYLKRKEYRELQKAKLNAILFGLAIIASGILSAVVTEGDLTVAILIVPLGIYVIVVACRAKLSDYYDEYYDQDMVYYEEEES